MAELRWNPLLGTWTMVASNRSQRPHLPKDWCPFCPGETNYKVPASYEVYKYDNDFPILTQDPDVPDPVDGGPYRTTQNYGKCEVILYSPEHTVTLPELSLEHIEKLVDLWVERNDAMSKDEKIKNVFIFENRGKEVGVTMPHPHGQIYGYSYIPQKIETELQQSKDYYYKEGQCLLCAMNAEEKRFAKRILIENDSFLAYLPFFTDYPYGAFITAKRHLGNLSQMQNCEKKDLAEMLKRLTGGMDCLFDKLFPYMMVMHQTPVNHPDYSDAGDYYHFHIEFYPPLREKDKIKFYASSEMGAWAAANVKAVEETAQEFREAIQRFDEKSVTRNVNDKKRNFEFCP